MQCEEPRQQQAQPQWAPPAAANAGAAQAPGAAATRPAQGPPPLVLAPPPVQLQVRIARPTTQQGLPQAAGAAAALAPAQLHPPGQPQPQPLVGHRGNDQPSTHHEQPTTQPFAADLLLHHLQHAPAPNSQPHQSLAGADGAGANAARNAAASGHAGGHPGKGLGPDSRGELPRWAPPPARHAAIHGAALAFNRASPGLGLEPAVIPAVTVAVEDVPWPPQQAHQLHYLEQLERGQAQAAAGAQVRAAPVLAQRAQRGTHAGDGSPVSVGAPSAFSGGSAEEDASGASGALMAVDGGGLPQQPGSNGGVEPMEGVAQDGAGRAPGPPPEGFATQGEGGGPSPTDRWWSPDPVPMAPPRCADPRSPLHVPRTRLAVYDRYGRLLATLERYAELWDIPSDPLFNLHLWDSGAGWWLLFPGLAHAQAFRTMMLLWRMLQRAAEAGYLPSRSSRGLNPAAVAAAVAAVDGSQGGQASQGAAAPLPARAATPAATAAEQARLPVHGAVAALTALASAPPPRPPSQPAEQQAEPMQHDALAPARQLSPPPLQAQQRPHQSPGRQATALLAVVEQQLQQQARREQSPAPPALAGPADQALPASATKPSQQAMRTQPLLVQAQPVQQLLQPQEQNLLLLRQLERQWGQQQQQQQQQARRAASPLLSSAALQLPAPSLQMVQAPSQGALPGAPPVTLPGPGAALPGEDAYRSLLQTLLGSLQQQAEAQATVTAAAHKAAAPPASLPLQGCAAGPLQQDPALTSLAAIIADQNGAQRTLLDQLLAAATAAGPGLQ